MSEQNRYSFSFRDRPLSFISHRQNGGFRPYRPFLALGLGLLLTPAVLALKKGPPRERRPLTQREESSRAEILNYTHR